MPNRVIGFFLLFPFNTTFKTFLMNVYLNVIFYLPICGSLLNDSISSPGCVASRMGKDVGGSGRGLI
jgi:hypothetical protein